MEMIDGNLKALEKHEREMDEKEKIIDYISSEYDEVITNIIEELKEIEKEIACRLSDYRVYGSDVARQIILDHLEEYNYTKE